MVPIGGYFKGIFIQYLLVSTGVLTNVHSCLIIKGYVIGSSDPERGILHRDIQPDGISTIPDEPNTLIH